MDAQNVQLMMTILGPLLGAGAGTYFGLKGALNGLRESARRADLNLDAIKEINRQTLFEMIEHRKESQNYVRDLREELRKP